MRKHVTSYPDRVWAVEGGNGAGRPLAQRLLADGEHVVDVPAKLSARARKLDTGHNRKTDAHDAHAVASVAVHPWPSGALPRPAAGGVADVGRSA
jgi:transposase